MKTEMKNKVTTGVLGSHEDESLIIQTEANEKRKPVNDCELKMADIILVHTKRSLWSWIIRLGTHSYWNHALIVCNPGNRKQGYENALIVDPKTDGSIKADYLSKYIRRLDKHDIAVVRLEAPWFQNNPKSDKPDIRSRICIIAADEVVTNNKSILKELINQVIRQATVILRFICRKIKGNRKLLHLPWSIHPVQVKAFTCGGFVQWCYYKGVADEIKETGANSSRLKDVLFNGKINNKVTPFELLTTTPADLANCSKLTWKYVIKDRVMWQVSNKIEAQLITEIT